MLTPSGFDLDLPPELIAQTALPGHTASRLLAVRRMEDAMYFEDRQFAGLVDYLRPSGLLVFNDTRVVKARFFDWKVDDGKVRVLVEHLLDKHTVLTQIRSSKSPAEGTTLHLADVFDTMVSSRAEPSFMLRFLQPALDPIEQYGRLPLPPYIEHDPNSFDKTRYQAVYARNLGAMTASAAGLHFDDALSAKLDTMDIQRGFLTLHVGVGTFQSIRVENIAEHHMHSEWCEIAPELAETIRATCAAGGRIITVDTTSIRALESAVQPDGAFNACSGETDIFITPGYRSRVVGLLVTNFHLPKSTLLILVPVFAGMSAIWEAHQYAIAQRYCFFSYGDAMLLTRTPTEPGEPGRTQSF